MSNVRILQDVSVHNSLTAVSDLYIGRNAMVGTLAIGVTGSSVSPDSTKALYVSGDTYMSGSLTVAGSANFVNTTFSTTSSLSVQNTGTGPALVAIQTGEEAIAAFYDDNNIALWVDGVAARQGHVGIGTKTPNEKLTVVGNISSNDQIYGKSGLFTQNVTAYEFVGIGTQLTSVFGTDTSKLPLAGGVLTGGLTGTNVTFNTLISSSALTGTIASFNTVVSSDTDNALSIVDIGYGPTLYIYQSGGSGDMISISSEEYGEVFHISNDGKIGIKESLPTKELTVNGEISANNDIWGNIFHGYGAALSGTLSGTVGLFTTSLSTPNLSSDVGLFTISLSAPNLSGSFYGNGTGLTNVIGTDPTKLPLSGGRLDGNLVINGSITALSGATFVNTIFTTTSALSIVNTGIGPALYVSQNGISDIASFYDSDQNIEVLHIGGVNSTNPNVGIKTSTPNKTLTVNGEISATSDIWADKFRGDGSQLTNVLGTDVSKLPLSGGTLTGELIGTTATFNSISAQSISGTFYGDISNAVKSPHYFVTCRAGNAQTGSMNTSTVPNTFTYSTQGQLGTIDSYTPLVGDTILFAAQADSKENGPWEVVNRGGVGTYAILKRPNFFSGTVKFGMFITIAKGNGFQAYTYAVIPSPVGTSDILVGTSNIFLSICVTRGANNATNYANIFTSTQTLAVGSTTTAPLRFQAGTLLTTPVQNSVEWDGNFMYLTTSGANSARTTNVAFVSAPASASSYGLSGQVAYDSSFFYVCTGANTWLKTALTTNGLSPSFDGTKLPLSGGNLTGPVTGTFYGDGGNLYNLPSQINFVFDGGGNAIEANTKGYVQIPYNIKIVSWTLLANAASTSIVQVLTSNFSSHPTYNVISSSTNKPELVNASKASSSTMTGWTTAIPADSYLQFIVTSNNVASNLTLSLKCLRTS